MPRWNNQFRTAQLVATAKTYPQGYHKGNTTGLDGIDADLATGNIKSGITLFGVAGSASVLDVSDADAAVTDVKSPRTFYSVTGPRKTGTMPTVAITAANDNYPAGYHAGNAGGLDAIDTDLAAANIKSGVNIFGFTGPATVQEIGAADAAVTDVKAPRTFFSVTGGIKTGTLATVTLDPALNAYPAGYHAGAASLTAVDADLATGNIKSGITIFGVAGAATVQDISAANAAVGEVLSPKTFFSVTGAIKTGTMATVTLIADNSAYPAGYHAGAASLAAIDAHLAVGNIKTGVNIFGYVGTYDTTASAPTAAQIISGRVAWANGAQITGTMPTVALDPAANAYPAGYHAGAASLTAVDADLAAGNIKSGVTIFGVLGTYAPSLVEDITGSAATTLLADSAGVYRRVYVMGTGTYQNLATVTPTFAAVSRAVATAYINGQSDVATLMKLQLLMGGVQMAEVAIPPTAINTILVATRALSGAQACLLRAYNSSGATQQLALGGYDSGGQLSAGIGVGSIKI